MWRHNKLRDCRIQIGQGYIELDEQGFVVSPTAYALDVLQRYGNVAEFVFVTPIEDNDAEGDEPTSDEAEHSEPPASKQRRRTTRKTAK
jgi:hypothetical protein